MEKSFRVNVAIVISGLYGQASKNKEEGHHLVANKTSTLR